MMDDVADITRSVDQQIADMVEGALEAPETVPFPMSEGDSSPPDSAPDAPGDDGAGETGKGGVKKPRGKSTFDIGRMNEEFSLVLMGSKAVVVREQAIAPVEDRLRILSVEAFNAYHCNRFTTVGSDDDIKTVTVSKRWLMHPKRRTYDGIEFYPDPEDKPNTPNYLNLWRGFSVKPERREGAGWSILKDHMLTNLCGGDEKLFTWLFGWFAHMFQRPRERIGTALVFRGKMGTGKTVVGDVMGSLIEAHYFLVDEPRYITGQFNAHMASCLLLQAEEAVWAGDKAAEGRLKSLITSKIQMIEAKGIDPIRIANYVRLVMTSNEGWVVPAGMDERRFAVLDVGAHAKGNYGYFAEMYQQLDNGGREALLADLLAFDLSRVELREIPKTEALLEQKIRSLGHVEQWWFGRLMDGSTTAKSAGWMLEAAKADVVEDYLTTSDRVGIKRRAAEAEMGMTLKKLIPGLKDARPWRDNSDGTNARVRCWIFPPLAECRAFFEGEMQQPIPWPDDGQPSARERALPDEL